VYFLVRRFLGLEITEVSTSVWKRFRAIDLIFVVVFSFGGFWGVLEGVGSIPPARLADDLVGRWVVDFSSPSEVAACELSAKREPEARRTASIAGWRFFVGEGIGEAAACLFDFFTVRGDCGLMREPFGDGVRARC
jgi:hypothetical protein